MCIAITKPADTAPDWKAYEVGFRSNPDGWGFAVAYDGKIVAAKDVTSFDDFRKKFEPLAHLPALVHFRIKTHGKVDKRNCHPFLVAEDMACIHNGTISIKCNRDEDMSDTWHFVELVLKPMYEGDPTFAWNHGSQFLAEQFIGWSKMAFLRADGQFAWWHRDKGFDVSDGHWYSNGGYIESPRQTSCTTTLFPYGSSRVSHSAYDDTIWDRTADECRRDEYPDMQDYWAERKERESQVVTKREYEADRAAEQRDLIGFAKRSRKRQKTQADPIYQALGEECTRGEYDNATALLQMGMSMDLIKELYLWDPSALDTLVTYHDCDYEYECYKRQLESDR
jgi:hypothetical protein